MAKLKDVSQQIMDLYFQDFAPNDSFFQLSDFQMQVANTYSTMLNALFQAERKMNTAQQGSSNVEIPAQWTVEETLDIKYDEAKGEDYVETSSPIYAFDFDNSGYAVQPLIGRGNQCNGGPCNYRRINTFEQQFLHITPPTSVVFYLLKSEKKIVFFGSKKGAKVAVPYIPQVVASNDDCLLSDNIIKPLTDEVLSTFFKAKNGNFVDMVNDQNSNVIPQQQTPPALGKQ